MKGKEENAEDPCLKITLSEVPAGTRLEKFLKDFSTVKPESVDGFLRSVYEECRAFLKEKLNARFPDILLKWCNSKQSEKEWLDAGKSGKPPTAFILHSSSPLIPDQIIVDVQRLLQANEQTFIVNLTLNIMEELLHSLYSSKSEQEVHDLLYPLAEEFLGIPLPEAYKKFKVRDEQTTSE